MLDVIDPRSSPPIFKLGPVYFQTFHTLLTFLSELSRVLSWLPGTPRQFSWSLTGFPGSWGPVYACWISAWYWPDHSEICLGRGEQRKRENEAGLVDRINQRKILFASVKRERNAWKKEKRILLSSSRDYLFLRLWWKEFDVLPCGCQDLECYVTLIITKIKAVVS